MASHSDLEDPTQASTLFVHPHVCSRQTSDLHLLGTPGGPRRYVLFEGNVAKFKLTDAADAEHDRPLSAGLELAEHDIPEGYVLRLHAYKQAWDRCLERVQVRWPRHEWSPKGKNY